MNITETNLTIRCVRKLPYNSQKGKDMKDNTDGDR